MSTTESIMLLHERVNRLEGMSWFPENVTKKEFDDFEKRILNTSLPDVYTKIERLESLADSYNGKLDEVSRIVEEYNTRLTDLVNTTVDSLNEKHKVLEDTTKDLYKRLSVITTKNSAEIAFLEGYRPEPDWAHAYTPSVIPVQYPHVPTAPPYPYESQRLLPMQSTRRY